MKILITGSTGLVGQSLVSDARADAHDILKPTHTELDLTDARATHAYLESHKPDLILHAAGYVGGIAANMAEQARFLSVNMSLGLNVLGAARSTGIRRVINLGSSCMYPKDIDGTLKESMLLTGPFEPTNEAYAIAKVAAWKYAAHLTRETPGVLYRTLVPCNLYGPGDHFDLQRSHLAPAAIMKVAAAKDSGASSVEIWGDGTARREFMFASDLADFIWTFHDRLEDLPEVLNVGVGEDHTINEYYAAAAGALGYSGAFTHDLSKPAGMRRKLLDVSGQTRLGWAPSTSLEAGIAATVAYYRGL